MNSWHLTAQEQSALLAFAQRLVRTSSLPGQEGEVAALVMEELRRLGYTEVWMDAAGNVLGRLGTPGGPTLMLNSHMDTVRVADPAAWTVDPLGAEVRHGRLYGLGAADMKAALAATIYSAVILRRRAIPLRGQLLVAAVGLEEPAEGTGTRALLEENNLRPDWVVIAEPSNLQIVRAQRGHLELLVSVKGRSAHSSSPELGENAIYAASRIIFGLELLAEQLAEDPFLGPGVLAVTDIRSHAVSRNAIPDRCDLIVDRRLTVGETEVLALAEVRRVLAREGVNAEVRVIEEEVQTHTGKVYRARRSSAPWALEERHPLVQALVHAAREVGIKTGLGRWSFATEGSYTAGVVQIPTVGFGPGDPAVAHTVDESVELEQLYAATGVYAALAARLLK